MATYKPRIDQYTTGATPAGWTSQWDAATSFTATASATEWGKDLTVNAAFAARTVYTLDEAGTHSEQEGLAQCVRGTTAGNIRLRVSGNGSAETGYFLRLNQNDWQVSKYTAASPADVKGTTAYPVSSTHIKARFRVETNGANADLKVKIWAYGTEEPTAWTWEGSDLNTTITSGLMGIGTITGAYVYEGVTFADNGDTAPDFSVYVSKEANAVASGATVGFGAFPAEYSGAIAFDFREVGGASAQDSSENFFYPTVTGSIDYEVEISDDNGVYCVMPLGNVTTTTDTVAIEPLDGEYTDSLVVTNPTTSTPAISWTSTSTLNSYVRLDNVNGKTPTFNVSNIVVEPHSSGFPAWWTGAPYYSYTPEDDSSWVQFTPANTTVNDGASTMAFFDDNAFSANTVYVSICPPAKQKDNKGWVAGILADALVTTTSSGDSTGFYAWSKAVSGTSTRVAIPRKRYAFKLGTGSLKFVLITGQHAAEDAGELVFRRFVEFLLSADATAVALRSAFTFYCYPALNTSRDIGANRSEYPFINALVSEQLDPNRNWGTFTADSATDCYTAILADTGGTVDAGFDFHGAAFRIAPFGYCMSQLNGGTVVNDDFIANYETYTNTFGVSYEIDDADQPGDGRFNEFFEFVYDPPIQFACTVESQHYFNGDYAAQIDDHAANLAAATLATYNDGNFVEPEPPTPSAGFDIVKVDLAAIDLSQVDISTVN